MRLNALIGTTILGLVLGSPALAGAQHGHDDDRHEGSGKEHGNKHQKEHEHSSAQEHADKHHGNGPEHAHQQPSHEQRRDVRERHEEVIHRQPEHVREVRHEREHERFEHRDAWEHHRAQHWEREHHSWHERGGYRGYRIPPERFHAHFGRAHWFRVHRAPILVVGGFPRFQYGGFWFSVVDPCPEYWSRTWYETDDVYIDYVNDGYYMYNRRHPGVAVAINISL